MRFSFSWRQSMDKHALPLCSGVIFTVVTIVIIRERPYFGNMQDGQNLRLLREAGLAELALGFDHLNFGTLSQSAYVLNSFKYLLGLAFGPAVFYLANVFLLGACLLAFWAAFRPLIAESSPPGAVSFLAVSMLWPFSADFIFFPTLLENWIILGAAGLLGWITLVQPTKRAAVRLLLFVAVFLFAFTTKLHIVVFLPGLTVALVLAPETPGRKLVSRESAAVLGAFAAGSLVLLLVAARGVYTSERQGAIFDPERLLQWRFLLLFGATGVVALVEVLRRPWRRWVHPSDARANLVPLIFMLSLAGSFLVWDVYQRHLAIASVMFGAFAAVQVSRLDLRKGRLVAAFLLLLSAGWLWIRLPHVFSSLGSFGEFIRSEHARELSEDNETVFSTCPEARFNYSYYAEAEGIPRLQFGWLGDSDDPTDPASVSARPILVLADHVLCPLSASSWYDETREVAVVWESERGRGFRLLTVTP